MLLEPVQDPHDLSNVGGAVGLRQHVTVGTRRDRLFEVRLPEPGRDRIHPHPSLAPAENEPEPPPAVQRTPPPRPPPPPNPRGSHSRTTPRVAALRSGATASSRSRIRPSAGEGRALAGVRALPPGP